jgi:hypothetical protein
MPAEETLRGQWLVIVLRRVQHHLHDAFDVTVGRPQPADVDAESTRDRRADLVRVQRLAFDLAALQHVLGKRPKNGLLPHPEAQCLHLTDQPPLPVPGRRQGERKPPVIPTEPGPVLKLMDIGCHSPHVLR